MSSTRTTAKVVGHSENRAVFSCPRIGQAVRVHYRVGTSLNHPGLPAVWPLHARAGVVRVRSRGKGPRNHAVEINGSLYVVPCGNLYPAAEVTASPPGGPTRATPPPPSA